jgi:CBS domain-containing protein
MRCEELMKRDVVTVSAEDTAQEAARLMREENVGFLPICDGERKVVGTLTDRDIAIRLVAAGQAASCAVRDIMTDELVACRPGDDVREAERKMVEHRKSRIVCTDAQGRIAGVISLSDIAVCETRGRAAEVLRGVAEREAPSAF